MADEKNIPVKELDDGRVMAAVEAEEDPFDEDKKDNEKEAEIEVEASDANDSDESSKLVNFYELHDILAHGEFKAIRTQ